MRRQCANITIPSTTSPDSIKKFVDLFEEMAFLPEDGGTDFVVVMCPLWVPFDWFMARIDTLEKRYRLNAVVEVTDMEED